MKLARHGYYENITADDLMKLVDATPEHPDAKWHFRVSTIAEYFDLARALRAPDLDLIASSRVQVWCPRGVARKIRKHHAAVKARRAIEDMLNGINAS